jgi:glutaredoxin
MTKVTLYYANWCGHCKNFKLTWSSLKPYFKKYNIEFKEYEDSENRKIMEENNINSFPTIIIEKNKYKYEYNGDRTVDGLINELIPNIQLGGRKKIKKYKIKYNMY